VSCRVYKDSVHPHRQRSLPCSKNKRKHRDPTQLKLRLPASYVIRCVEVAMAVAVILSCMIMIRPDNQASIILATWEPSSKLYIYDHTHENQRGCASSK
jgi:hypothetical protein